MGRYQAVAETLGIRWRGFPAWFLARSYHLLMMPGIAPPRAARGRLDRSACCSGATRRSWASSGTRRSSRPPGSSEQSSGGTAPDGSGRPEDANVR